MFYHLLNVRTIPFVLKRDSLEANRNLGTKIDANNPQNLHVFETGYTRKNQYDNFNVLGNRNPIKEYTYTDLENPKPFLKFSIKSFSDIENGIEKLVNL